MPTRLSCSIALALLALAAGANAQTTPLDRLKAYIEIDTTNPPGNETRAVEFFAKIFDRAGIAYETAESAPGRGNIWARLKGGEEPALVLLHHMDVVPATAEAWDTNPLEAVVKDGELIGRGALDTKSLGIMDLEAFLALQRRHEPLNRDVIFMATADEEAGGYFGAGWLVEHRPEIFKNVGYLLNEGGRGSRQGDAISFSIEVAQKRPYWLKLTATDEAGHGSRPLPTSAPTRLIAALQRIQSTPFEPRVIELVREMFTQLAPYMGEEWRKPMLDIDEAIEDPAFLARFQAAQSGLHALLRNTCSITMLSGSQKINVVPPTASAELDCRILPDQDAAAFLNAIRERIADDHIKVEELMLFSPAQSSSDTTLYRQLGAVIKRYYPTAGIVTSVTGGFTDSHFFRDLGIASYGFSPVIVPEDAARSVHGNNERIGIATFNEGVEIMTELVRQFATKQRTAIRS
jgi:acetylornithine deacetylase/succinyl-diaminopimelate desuccinylase-like protein